jgi:hypothetical protein
MNTVYLTPLGKMTNCESWHVPNGDYITNLELSYSTLGLQHIQLTTSKKAVIAKGTKETYH